MLALAIRNLSRRRLRTALTLFGVAAAVMTLASLLAFGEGYQHGLRRELDGMGIQMMLVPLGCPYDAAARVLKGRTLDVSLPESALATAKSDTAVANAAPMLMATLPRPSEGRTDLWIGVDESIRPLKPWWRLSAGSHWFQSEESVILGAEAAATELRRVGDSLYSPETGRRFTVCGILERSGTSDDSQFFIPLGTAQAMFHQPQRLTAVAIRLKDPALLPQASTRLQEIRGAQVVTLTEMMGTFLNLVGAVRTLIMAIAIVALGISGLTIFNTLLASVLERTAELGVLRAVGASRPQVFALLALEALLLTIAGSGVGILLAKVGGVLIERMVRGFVPLAPDGDLLALTWTVAAQCASVGILIGLVAGIYPAWKASNLSPTQALRAE
jgi:putative ABC transport system permease protein